MPTPMPVVVTGIPRRTPVVIARSVTVKVTGSTTAEVAGAATVKVTGAATAEVAGAVTMKVTRPTGPTWSTAVEVGSTRPTGATWSAATEVGRWSTVPAASRRSTGSAFLRRTLWSATTATTTSATGSAALRTGSSAWTSWWGGVGDPGLESDGGDAERAANRCGGDPLSEFHVIGLSHRAMPPTHKQG
jgi:hypothetical protein